MGKEKEATQYLVILIILREYNEYSRIQKETVMEFYSLFRVAFH